MTGNGTSSTYTYDANNRLTKSITEQGSTKTTADYYYDHNGNNISKMVMTNAPKTGDAEGRLYLSANTDDNIALYEYNSYNQLVKVDTDGKVTTYAYDGSNLRQSKTTNGITTQHIWDGSNMVMDGTNKFYRGATGIEFATLNGNTSFYHKDAHGDVTALTDNEGTITQNYIYDAFGNQMNENENDINPFRYCGEYQDNETGLTYLRNRYYDNSIGRFITEDPIKDGLNWYVYCGNNPVIFVDPLGLAPGDTFDSMDEAAIDAGNYLLPKTHKNDKEMTALIYSTANGYTYYETPNIDPNPKYAFYIEWDIIPLAVVHTHVYYQVDHPNNILSNPNNTTGTDGASDTNFTETTGIILYGAMPTGELRKYSKGDYDIEGTVITTELVVDPKYTTYQQFKNTLIWPLLVSKFASTGNKENDEKFKMDVIKARVTYPNNLYNVLKEVSIVK